MSAALYFGDVVRDAPTLAARGLRLAGGLRALGLREGDVVAVLLRNDPVYADVMHACRIAGLYYCPLNWHFTPSELAVILADCGARVVVGGADLLDAAAGVLPAGATVLSAGGGGAFADYDAWLATQPEYDGPAVSPRGLMGYTSGTTGRPKGVRSASKGPPPIESMAMMGAGLSAMLAIPQGGVTLVCGPVYHSAQWAFSYLPLIAGSTVVMRHKFDPAELLELID
ncbi:MAG TPA: AMP-binding protein, partial [Candidatus Elarobacter sp.]